MTRPPEHPPPEHPPAEDPRAEDPRAGTGDSVDPRPVGRPRSIPAGLVVELSRAKVLPGAGAEADRWMRMLDARVEECVATLDRERMAVEIVFRLREDGEDHLYWVAIRGEGGADLESSEHAIDRDHVAQARRTKEPGWVEAEPQVLMLPGPVREAVLAWALREGPDGVSG